MAAGSTGARPGLGSTLRYTIKVPVSVVRPTPWCTTCCGRGDPHFAMVIASRVCHIGQSSDTLYGKHGDLRSVDPVPLADADGSRWAGDDAGPLTTRSHVCRSTMLTTRQPGAPTTS
jgi:hypothetical protein